MKVLFVASEAYPFIKTGGLGDVVFSLPRELRKLGIDARIMIPKYSDIPDFFRDKMSCVSIFNVPVGWRNQHCGVEQLRYEDMTCYFIDNQYYFKRAGIYGFYDEAERYAFFCRAALESIKYLDFKPDIIHCHDWHTGMISVILNAHYREDMRYNEIKTVFTIHNLQYQGVFPKEILGELLDLGEEYFNPEGVEFFGGVNFMMGGLNYSNIIATESSTYAEEIQNPYFGERLDSVFRRRKSDLYGIVNGIDYDSFNPKTDRNICKPYDLTSFINKSENKTKLQELLNLQINSEVPLVAMVCSLTRQKGLDLVAHAFEELMDMDMQFVVLGMGDNSYEAMFKDFATRYPGKVSANIAYDEALAHRIFAGADIYLRPSLFEPSGIGQLIALRYGTIPVVRETGGLKDTVKSYNENTGVGNGICFTHYNSQDMVFALKRAISLYEDKIKWMELVGNAMEADFSWRKTATAYKKLYLELV